MAVTAGATDALWEAAPGRLRSAARAVRTLRSERGVYFAPVRHHSPACAVAVRVAIEELRPSVVLIEGPEEFTRLVPDLLHEATRPPVAVLSLDAGAGFYPLASFSPEWVALRAGQAVGAGLAFIDRSFGERSDEERAVSGQEDPFARTLMSERYLAHSEAVATLARRLGCRDHDEVWDHLFETRPSSALADWRTLFDDVFAWAALARLDYEQSVLAADGSLDREARMAARIAEALDRRDADTGAGSGAAGSGAGPAGDAAEASRGPVLVVTGAFHTLALVEALSGAPDGAAVRDRQPEAGYGAPEPDEAWLVRYDHERLDGLRGYGAGMPSPGYYERLHAAHLRELGLDDTPPGQAGATAGSGGRSAARSSGGRGGVGRGGAGAGSAGPVGPGALAAEVLVDVARGAADRGHAVSLPQVTAAAEAATRLADLRERAFPGRTDLLDAMRSCYVQDDGGIGGPGEPERPLGLAIAEVFGDAPWATCRPGTRRRRSCATPARACRPCGSPSTTRCRAPPGSTPGARPRTASGGRCWRCSTSSVRASASSCRGRTTSRAAASISSPRSGGTAGPPGRGPARGAGPPRRDAGRRGRGPPPRGGGAVDGVGQW
nr:hypothetical protein GCM10025730_49300 [Promicromonospora thailandica]